MVNESEVALEDFSIDILIDYLIYSERNVLQIPNIKCKKVCSRMIKVHMGDTSIYVSKVGNTWITKVGHYKNPFKLIEALLNISLKQNLNTYLLQTYACGA